eukprot:m.906976 g.906976  ORF g.906976 m.906976 type:complete len:95 (-) comp23710_c0_seq1:27-311(-)
MAEIEVKILRTGGSGTVSITATLESTTLELKQKIQAATSIAPEEQRLIFAGRVLKDHETLQQCCELLPTVLACTCAHYKYYYKISQLSPSEFNN